MAGSATTFAAARFLLPDYIVRAQDSALSCPVWLDGNLYPPASGTCTVYDPQDTVIQTGTVTITAQVPTFTLLAANVPSTLQLQSGWRVEWALTWSTGTVNYQNKAHLVRSELHPVVTAEDLYRRQPALDPKGTAPISAEQDFQSYLDEAWVVLLARILGKGPLPFLIMEPTALRESHLTLTLSLIYEAFSTRLNEAYMEHATMYRERYEAAFADLKFEYDSDQDGQSDGPAKRSASGSVWLMGRRN